ncbi:MAG: SAM-dependent chlorinase/fluorinase, partial [Spirochaetaceae bacterium]|nr:SAM-dependent chlorinase/fluorinase [Spirochaetaceae bacterium]
MNNKFKKLLFLFTISITLVFTSCAVTSNKMNSKSTGMSATVETVKIVKSVEGTFVAADKYGNMETSIKASDLLDNGYAYGDMVNVVVDGVSYIAPIVMTYSDVNVGNFLISINGNQVFFAINYGNCQKKTGAEAKKPLTISMNKAGAYSLEFEIRHLVKVENRTDVASDEIFANFRDVTIGAIKEGVLFRSANPALADARAPYAEKLAKEAGVKTIVNFADSEKSLAEHMNSIHWYKDMYQTGHVILLDMNVDYSSAEFGEKLGRGFNFMSENAGPYLIHCNEGKDRAGFASVILESLMGGTIDEIQADYMISYDNYYGVKSGTDQYNYIADTPYNMLLTISNGVDVTN